MGATVLRCTPHELVRSGTKLPSNRNRQFIDPPRNLPFALMGICAINGRSPGVQHRSGSNQFLALASLNPNFHNMEMCPKSNALGANFIKSPLLKDELRWLIYSLQSFNPSTIEITSFNSTRAVFRPSPS